jgi:PilZ domain
MFGRSKSPGDKAALADRVRHVGERKVAPAYEAPPPPEKATWTKPKDRSDREPHFRNGVLLLPGGQRLSVIIKNLSDTGARIDFFVKTELPDEVVLNEPTLKLMTRARVVWRNDGAAGLEFMAS